MWVETSPSEDPTVGARPWLRVLAFVLPAVLLVGLLTIAIVRKGSSPELGDTAPGFTAPLLMESGELSLDDLRGMPVVLNFWASWCGPCEDEAPLFADAARRFEDEILFVGVDVRDARSDAIAFVEEHDLHYLHVRDEGSKIYADYGLTGQPETFFISSDGEIVEHVAGPVFADDLERLLVRLGASNG